MKNQIKLLLVALTISTGIFACKGSVNTGDIGTTPPGADSIKTTSDSHIDTAGKNTNLVVDTTKMADTTTKK